MDTAQHVVIVGAGLAGAKTAEALREQGFDGELTLLGAETELPYERPPLSKGFLSGSDRFDQAVIHPAQWYHEQSIDLRLGTRAVAVDAPAHRLRLADGSEIDYHKLVLATGATPRRIPLPGAEASGVHYLRTRADAEAIQAHFGADQRLVIIGGGWVGLEVAAVARGAGTQVSVLEAAELPLLGVLGSEIAPVFADLHREHGVDLRLGTRVAAIEESGGAASGVRLADGTVLPADGVVVGVGVIPEVDLARAAGLAVDDGILVDAGLRSSDPDIYAVGDIANHDHPVLGHRVRVEHWANALNQPAIAAANLLGADHQYSNLPFFYSDQYDLGLEYIGHSGDASQVVVRGDLAGREFVACWVDATRRLKAAMNVNVWDVVDQVKALIVAGRPIDLDRLRDPDVPFSAL